MTGADRLYNRFRASNARVPEGLALSTPFATAGQLALPLVLVGGEREPSPASPSYPFLPIHED